MILILRVILMAMALIVGIPVAILWWYVNNSKFRVGEVERRIDGNGCNFLPALTLYTFASKSSIVASVRGPAGRRSQPQSMTLQVERGRG